MVRELFDKVYTRSSIILHSGNGMNRSWLRKIQIDYVCKNGALKNVTGRGRMLDAKSLTQNIIKHDEALISIQVGCLSKSLHHLQEY